MKRILFLCMIYGVLANHAVADNTMVQSKHNVSNHEERQDSQDKHTPISFFPTKRALVTNRVFDSVRNLSFNFELAKSGLVAPHTNPVKVMSTIQTKPIFWGANWYNPRFYSDKVLGLMSFYQNIQSSTYTDNISEYLPDKLDHYVVSPVIDTSPASLDSQDVLNKICDVAGAFNADTDYFPVYVDLKRGNASFCAYHGAGTCNGHPVQFAFFFNIDDDPDCDPQSPYAPPVKSLYSQRPGAISGLSSNYQQSQGLAALANVSAHELMETITDPVYFPANGNPYWSGWFDAFGAEIGDKCAWTFGPSNTGESPGTVSIGSFNWKLQGTWSNEAQTSGIGGYPTKNGSTTQYGCISGS